MNPVLPTPMKIGAPLNNDPAPTLQWIEVASALQIPSFHIVGLPNQEVSEARERVRSAIAASGLDFPRRRVVLNLSPASIRKRGTGIDLAMALAVLSASCRESVHPSAIWVAWGELGLDGSIKAAGQLTRAIYAAWKSGAGTLLLAEVEADQAHRSLSWIQQSRELQGRAPEIVPVANLSEAWKFMTDISKRKPLFRLTSSLLPEIEPRPTSGLIPLPGSLERLLGIAAAGRHHILLLGPRGAGKSHALEWLTALQPPFSPKAFLHQVLLAELRQNGTDSPMVPGTFSESIRRIGAMVRPAALVGNVSAGMLQPGEFSLAHGGLLIADELPEWARDSRESLREPLERGKITLTRKQISVELPASFTLAANGNLCPCGGWPPEIRPPFEDTCRGNLPDCSCSPVLRRGYLARLSGPILDRIDIVQLMRGKSKSEIRGSPKFTFSASEIAERLEKLRSKVAEAQRRSTELWGKPPGLLTASEAEEFCKMIPSRISAANLRARHKLIRLALTLACWDGVAKPRHTHFMEASLYRPDLLLLKQ